MPWTRISQRSPACAARGIRIASLKAQMRRDGLDQGLTRAVDAGAWDTGTTSMVRIWQVSDGTMIGAMDGLAGYQGASLAFSPDSSRLAVAANHLRTVEYPGQIPVVELHASMVQVWPLELTPLSPPR